MFHAMISGGIQGMLAYQVRVEVDVSRGLPCFDIVGSAGREVKEARERVQVALRNGGYSLPVAKIIVNLSPAQIAKEGTGYDLAVAAGLLACMEVWRPEAHPDIAFLGELALNGEVRGIKGVLPIALALREQGIRHLVVAPENGGISESGGIRMGKNARGDTAGEPGRRGTKKQNSGLFRCVRSGGGAESCGGCSGGFSPYSVCRGAGSGENHDCKKNPGYFASHVLGGATGGCQHLQHCG